MHSSGFVARTIFLRVMPSRQHVNRIRQAMMSEKEIVASQGVYNWTEKDRNGLDERSRILLTVKNGKYVPAM